MHSAFKDDHILFEHQRHTLQTHLHAHTLAHTVRQTVRRKKPLYRNTEHDCPHVVKDFISIIHTTASSPNYCLK